MVEFHPNARPEDRDGGWRKPDDRSGAVPGSVREHDRSVGLEEHPGYRSPQEGRTRFPREERLPRDSRSILDLLKEMVDEVRLLLRQEVHLARTEMMAKAKAMARHAGYIAVGGAVAYAGLLAIIGAACAGAIVLLAWAGLSLANALWLGPLIVGIIVAVIGYAMLQSGMNRLRKDDVVPHRTAQTMRENAQWLQERAR
jgi:hypothetical protein